MTYRDQRIKAARLVTSRRQHVPKADGTSSPMPKRLLRFAYCAEEGVAKRPEGVWRLLPHQLRDGDAFIELSPVLYSSGYSYGGLLLNFPSRMPGGAIEFDLTSLKSSDLLLLTTRPPIDDDPEEDQRFIDRGSTPLEQEILRHLRHGCFKQCSREVLALQPHLARQLPREYANRARIEFSKNVRPSYPGATYKRLSRRHGSQRPSDMQQRTAVYLLSTQQVWRGGPGLLTAFGMSGIETLAWAYLLRTKFAKLLSAPRFVMAEILIRAVPPKPNDLSFADDWEVTILLDVPPPTEEEVAHAERAAGLNRQ